VEKYKAKAKGFAFSIFRGVFLEPDKGGLKKFNNPTPRVATWGITPGEEAG